MKTYQKPMCFSPINFLANAETQQYLLSASAEDCPGLADPGASIIQDNQWIVCMTSPGTCADITEGPMGLEFEISCQEGIGPFTGHFSDPSDVTGVSCNDEGEIPCGFAFILDQELTSDCTVASLLGAEGEGEDPDVELCDFDFD